MTFTTLFETYTDKGSIVPVPKMVTGDMKMAAWQGTC